jgi:hypothetical protein
LPAEWSAKRLGVGRRLAAKASMMALLLCKRCAGFPVCLRCGSWR